MHDDIATRLEAARRELLANPAPASAPPLAQTSPATAADAPLDPAEAPRLREIERCLAVLAALAEAAPPLTGTAAMENTDQAHATQAELSKLYRKAPAPFTPSNWSRSLRNLHGRRGPSRR